MFVIFLVIGVSQAIKCIDNSAYDDSFVSVDDTCDGSCIHIRYTTRSESELEYETARRSTSNSNRGGSSCASSRSLAYAYEERISGCPQLQCKTSADCNNAIDGTSTSHQGWVCVYTNPRWSTSLTGGTGVCMRNCTTDSDCDSWKMWRKHPAAKHRCLEPLPQDEPLPDGFRMCRADTESKCSERSDCLAPFHGGYINWYPVICNKTSSRCQYGCERDADCITRKKCEEPYTTVLNGITYDKCNEWVDTNRCRNEFELVDSRLSYEPTYARHCEASNDATKTKYLEAMQLAFGDDEGDEEGDEEIFYVSRCDTQNLCNGSDVNMTSEPNLEFAEDIVTRKYQCCDSDNCLPSSASTLALNALLLIAPILTAIHNPVP